MDGREGVADMLTQPQIAEFRERGFLLLGPVMRREEAVGLKKRLDDVLDGKSQAEPELKRNLLGETESVVVQVVNIWEADDLFREHIYNPAVCAAVADLIPADTLRVWHDQIQYKPPKVGGPTNWHQDHPYWPIIQPADLVSAWVALEDADVENGCMWMVPRSHRWGPHKNGTIGTIADGFVPDYDPAQVPAGERVEWVPCPVRAGEAMFHHCLTWHGSPPNRSERGRPAIAVHYMPGYTRYEPVSGHVMERRVSVQPGEILQGEYFPTVWDRGPVPH